MDRVTDSAAAKARHSTALDNALDAAAEDTNLGTQDYIDLLEEIHSKVESSLSAMDEEARID